MIYLKNHCFILQYFGKKPVPRVAEGSSWQEVLLFSTKKLSFLEFSRIFKVVCSGNLGQNICRIFHFLAQFSFTASESALDYYQHKVKVRFALRVAEWLRKLENFKKVNENLIADSKSPADQPKTKCRQL